MIQVSKNKMFYAILNKKSMDYLFQTYLHNFSVKDFIEAKK